MSRIIILIEGDEALQSMPRKKTLGKQGYTVLKKAWYEKSPQEIRLIFLLFLLIAFSSPMTHGQSTEFRPLVFLGNQSLPPMVYIENGKPSGIVVDIVMRLSQEIG